MQPQLGHYPSLEYLVPRANRGKIQRNQEDFFMQTTGDNEQWLAVAPAPKTEPYIEYQGSNLSFGSSTSPVGGTVSMAGLPAARRRAFAEAMSGPQ
jgi:hypothetical protein